MIHPRADLIWLRLADPSQIASAVLLLLLLLLLSLAAFFFNYSIYLFDTCYP